MLSGTLTLHIRVPGIGCQLCSWCRFPANVHRGRQQFMALVGRVPAAHVGSRLWLRSGPASTGSEPVDERALPCYFPAPCACVRTRACVYFSNKWKIKYKIKRNNRPVSGPSKLFLTMMSKEKHILHHYSQFSHRRLRRRFHQIMLTDSRLRSFLFCFTLGDAVPHFSRVSSFL